MNVLIIEDEPHAAKRLIRIGKEVAPEAFFHGPLESVVDAVEWLNDNPNPDLILVDIHLADGLSFEIFESIEAKFSDLSKEELLLKLVQQQHVFMYDVFSQI